MSSLHFDSYQFEGHHRNRPVHAEYTQEGWTSNGLSYDDFTLQMHTQPGSVSTRHGRWIPAFAASNEKLRRVLLHKAWAYVHNKHTTPTNDWKTVNAAATKRALGLLEMFQNCPTHKRGESVAHVAAVKHAGGYLELLAALAYRAWRLGQDSVGIAEALKISPQAVRVNLQRLCDVARELGYETFKRHDTYQRTRPKLAPKDIKQWFGRIIRWYREGRNVSQIAQAIGYPKGRGNNRVRHVLMNAGIYKGAKPRRHAHRQRVN